jgi:hypothetical protein
MTVFAHPSEAELASLLDRAGVRWEYEPTTFALEHHPDGSLRTAFTPDFYLPEHDLYVELTVLRQALVTRKNRKARLLRERHPEVRLRMVYRREWAEISAAADPGALFAPPVPAAA